MTTPQQPAYRDSREWTVETERRWTAGQTKITTTHEKRERRERGTNIKGIPTILSPDHSFRELQFGCTYHMHGDRELYLKNHGWWVRFLQEPQHHCERDGVSLFARGDLWRCLWIGKLIICMQVHIMQILLYICLCCSYHWIHILLLDCLSLRSHRSIPRGRLQP